jgi:hypothetical protein
VSDNNGPTRQLDLSATTVLLETIRPDGTFGVDVPLDIAFAAFSTIQLAGYDNAAQMIHFVSTVSKKLVELQVPEPSEMLYATLQRLHRARPAKLPTREELVLSFCYELLKDKSINWARAAEIANALLKSHPPNTPEGWRKKTERWIKRTEREKVGQRRRSK